MKQELIEIINQKKKTIEKDLTLYREDPRFFYIIIVLLTLSLIYHFLGKYLLTLELAAIAFILFFIYLKASFLVYESLFRITTEISLLVLLSQSYCDIQNRTANSDDALRGILGFGFLYGMYIFVKELIKISDEYFKKEEDQIKIKNKTLIKIIFYIFIIFITWQVALVISPVIQDSCVYRSNLRNK